MSKHNKAMAAHAPASVRRQEPQHKTYFDHLRELGPQDPETQATIDQVEKEWKQSKQSER